MSPSEGCSLFPLWKFLPSLSLPFPHSPPLPSKISLEAFEIQARKGNVWQANSALGPATNLP